MRTAIVDADSLVYQVGRANEQEIQWDQDLWTVHSFFEPCVENLNREVESIKQNLEADEIVMVLSDYNKPWRKELLPSYKSNRKDVRKPVTYRPLREYIHEVYRTFQRPGLEGDDCIGILLTNPIVISGEKIAVSLDKDMKTLPGMHVNLKKAQEQGHWFPFTITEEEANRWHMFQALTGDTTDGYKGCPGMGAVSAEKLLAKFDFGDGLFNLCGAWYAIAEAYEKKGLTEQDALVQARVSRILRHGDYDYTNKKVRLWNPPDTLN